MTYKMQECFLAVTTKVYARHFLASVTALLDVYHLLAPDVLAMNVTWHQERDDDTGNGPEVSSL